MRWSVGVLFLAAFGVAGCSNKPETTHAENRDNVARGVRRMFPAVDRTVVEAHLRTIGLAYQNCCTSGQPPTRVEELETYYERNALISNALRKGDYVLFWGTDPSKLPGSTILAYQKQPDEMGRRVVLLCNYEISLMPEAEFERTPKAGK
jgi:hypothetical protein